MENRGCLPAYENCDDSWVVTTEGPRGPKCTKSAGALIGLSARNGRESTGALENTSAGALLKSTGTLKNTSTGALHGEWDALEERKCLYSAV